MNSMDFLQGINDLDSDLIQSSAALLAQEDNMNQKKILKFTGHVSKAAVVAAVMVGVMSVTAVAAAVFPSIFRKMGGELTRKAAEMETVNQQSAKELKERADLLEKAADASKDAVPETTPLPEVKNGITIGETYYDGQNLLIGYQFDQEHMNFSMDFGPGSKHFEDLVPLVFNKPDGEPTIEEEFQSGVMPKEAYDKLKTTLKERGLSEFRYSSQFEMDERLRSYLSEEEYAEFYQKLRKDGHAGVSFRDMRIGGVMLEDDSILEGMGGQYRTEFGTCYTREGLDEYLPEELKEDEKLNLRLLGSAIDVYWYMDMETGASMYEELVEKIEVPVTVPRTAPTK